MRLSVTNYLKQKILLLVHLLFKNISSSTCTLYQNKNNKFFDDTLKFYLKKRAAVGL